MTEITSDAKLEPNAKKWNIVRKTRGGYAGDVMFVFGVLNATGSVLQQFEVSKDLGERLEKFGPGAIVNKIFRCGNSLDLTKHT
ncbi:MAG: hypothetical protein INF93_18245 [Rhodobacter sp.]|nr:hypothetical protein [Rhodobacter sp.]